MGIGAGGNSSIQLVVFAGFAFGFGDGIFGLHFFHFLSECVGRIDFQVVGEEEDGVEAVGQLVGDFGFAFFDGLGQLFALFPLEDFEEFGGFDGEGDGEFFGRVELGPVTGGAESEDELGEGCE